MAVAAILTTTSLYAQEGSRIPVSHIQTISANPFGLMIEWFHVEYERKLTNATTSASRVRRPAELARLRMRPGAAP